MILKDLNFQYHQYKMFSDGLDKIVIYVGLLNPTESVHKIHFGT